MATGTTLVTVKKALRTLLAARAGLAGVQVSYAKPLGGLLPEAVWFGGAEAPEARIAATGGTVKKVHENYSFTAVVQVLVEDGRDEEAADERAAALLGELQQAVAANPTLGSTHVVQMAGWEQSLGPVGEGTNRAARYDVVLTVHAELAP